MVCKAKHITQISFKEHNDMTGVKFELQRWKYLLLGLL